MRLTKRHIHHYLMDKGYLNPQSIVAGKYIVSQTSSRNSIFKITHGEPSGLFVKQLMDMDVQNIYLMQKDATVHYLIHNDSNFKKTATYLPKYYGYDPKENVFVTEYFPEAQNLYQLKVQQRKITLSQANQIAEILNSFHFDLSDQINENPSLQFFSHIVPWILNMGNKHIPDHLHPTNPVPSLIKKQSGIVKHLRRLRENWKGNSLIHGDVKWVNFIDNDPKSDNGLKLIDWEIADIGDPLWDVAGVFQSFLSFWTYSFDNQNFSFKKLNGLEDVDMKSMLPALHKFWNRYSELQSFDKDEKIEKLILIIKYTAARLFQTAYETNMAHEKLQPGSLRIIQLGQHMLDKPEELAKELFGFQLD